MGDNQYNLASRLTEVRSLARLSQAELAKKVEVSPSLISHWENGTRVPSQAQLIELAHHLGVSLDYLMNSEFRPAFQFRAKATLNAGQKADIERALLDASMQVHFVDAVCRMAEKPPQPFGLKADFTQPQLPGLASHFRQTLKLNKRASFQELKQALAEWDISVFEWNLPWQLSGLSFRGPFTVIIVNSLHTSQRRLFTLAHEFAHVLFHLTCDRQTTAVSIASCQDPQEKQANAFAGEFLLPTPDLKVLIKSLGRRLKDPTILEGVAQHFNVSRDALFYRLAQLDFFRWTEKHDYFTGHYQVPEAPPLRVDKIDEQVAPDFLQDALSLHQAEKVSAGKMAEWFFTSRLTFEDYWAELSREKENGIMDDAEGQLIETE